jgi:hypothetical protein
MVSSLDPIHGKSAELMKLPADAAGAVNVLSDGERLGILLPTDTGRRNRIRITALNGGPSREFVVKDATLLGSLDPLSNSEDFVAVDFTQKGTDLLLVHPDGSSRALWSPRELILQWAIPSPNDKHLAMYVIVPRVDAWLVSGF